MHIPLRLDAFVLRPHPLYFLTALCPSRHFPPAEADKHTIPPGAPSEAVHVLHTDCLGTSVSVIIIISSSINTQTPSTKMSEVQLQRSLEDIRLEIVLLAAEVFFLVSVLGAIILFNLDLYSQSRKLSLSAESYKTRPHCFGRGRPRYRGAIY